MTVNWKTKKEYKRSKVFSRGSKLIELCSPCLIPELGISAKYFVLDFVHNETTHRHKEVVVVVVNRRGKFMTTCRRINGTTAYLDDYESSTVRRASVFYEFNEKLAIDRLLGLLPPDKRHKWTVNDWLGP